MSWLARLKEGLSKSSGKISEGLKDILVRKPLDDAMLAEIEEVLIAADLGVETAEQLVQELKKKRFGKEVAPEEVRETLAESITETLAPYARPLDIDEHKPFVVLVVGVNGNGKTTTIGKLASSFKAQSKKVMLGAADTFRAAAMEQLKVWSDRADVPIVMGAEGADPASVAYASVEEAMKEQADVLFIDTAGRLQNKSNLMQELQKLVKVIKKIDPSAPHAVLQILDATTGQNAYRQVETFKKMIGVTGLIVTKLDGTAKAGVVVGLADQFKIPIHAIGVGEGIEDLQPFEAEAFAKGLVAL